LKAYLILGCNRYVDSEGFFYSESISNPIADLQYIQKDEADNVISFLEDACGLFEAPMFNYNKCTNTINFLYRNFSIINEDRLKKIQSFIRMHRRGGIFIMLTLKEDYDG
jgi:hypothetical protein|tara:strand:- start:9760 stop:10089 length:330 start_codon:yes stop_codon:yes gene_type:complete